MSLDSRHLCMCYYGTNTIHFFYKNYNISEEHKENFMRKDFIYKKSIINFCEMNKGLFKYYEAGENSIFFLLFSDNQFMIVRKIIKKVCKPKLK